MQEHNSGYLYIYLNIIFVFAPTQSNPEWAAYL